LGSVALFEMADAKREPRMTSYRFLDTRRAIQIGFDSHDEFRDVNQPARNGADPRPDLQYPRPDELSNQPEHMVHVPPGFLHGLEVVRSVAVLCLGVSAVGVKDARHVHCTVPERTPNFQLPIRNSNSRGPKPSIESLEPTWAFAL